MESISAVGGSKFRLSSAALATGGSSSTSSKLLDSYQSSSLLPDALRTRFGLLSRNLDGLTLSVPLSDLPANSSTKNGPHVTVRLPVEQSLLGDRTPGLNTMACLFWDEASGSFVSDGSVISILNFEFDVHFGHNIFLRKT